VDRVITTEALPKAWPRVVIGIPSERVRNTNACHGFAAILAQGFAHFPIGYMRTDIARCRLALQLLESDFTHLLMLDSDHMHPPDIVDRLVRWVRMDKTKLVVGGLNFRRGAPYDPCAYFLNDKGHLMPMLEWSQALVAVEVLGSGSILIAREVFETFGRDDFPWFGYDYEKTRRGAQQAPNWEKLRHGASWPGTDLWFSALCRKHGIKQWVDTTTTSPHIIETVVTQESWQQWKNDHPEMPRIKQEVKAFGANRSRVPVGSEDPTSYQESQAAT